MATSSRPRASFRSTAGGSFQTSTFGETLPRMKDIGLPMHEHYSIVSQREVSEAVAVLRLQVDRFDEVVGRADLDPRTLGRAQ